MKETQIIFNFNFFHQTAIELARSLGNEKAVKLLSQAMEIYE